MSQDLRYIHEQVEIMQTSLEEDLSPSHWTIMMHVMKHMAAQLERWGPVREMWMFGCRRLHYSRVDPPLKAIAPVGTGKMKMVSPELERSIMAWMDNLPEFDDVKAWWAAKKVALRQQISRRGRGQNEAGWLEAKDLLKRIVDGPTAENKAIWLGEGRDLTPFQDEILSKFVPPMLTVYPRMKVKGSDFRCKSAERNLKTCERFFTAEHAYLTRGGPEETVARFAEIIDIFVLNIEGREFLLARASWLKPMPPTSTPPRRLPVSAPI